jgi:hypothetical protein
MDVEKTIAFILEMQARAEVQSQKSQERMQQFEERVEKDHKIALERHNRAMARMDKFDIQLKATANLVRAGMKLVIEDRKEFKAGMADLRAAQKRTEATLARFIASLKGRNGNGHKK